jgi:aminoglycoside phosphotransferase (APT) family kinase protein
MDLLQIDKLAKFIQKKFEMDKEVDLLKLQPTSVNTSFIFYYQDKKYLVKIITRPIRNNHEFYRLDKEANLYRNFNKQLENAKLAGKTEQTRVPVPNVHYVVTENSPIGKPFIIIDYIEGEILEQKWPSLTKNNQKRIVKQFGNIVRQIHSVQYDMFGEIEEYHCPRRFYSFKSLMKANMKRGIKINLQKKLLSKNLIKRAQSFFEVTLPKIQISSSPRLVHSDLNRENIIIGNNHENNWEIKGIIDFEWAYAGHPLFDFFYIQKEDWWANNNWVPDTFCQSYGTDINYLKDESDYFRSLYTILRKIESIAFGWISFHPSEENIKHATTVLEKELAD